MYLLIWFVIGVIAFLIGLGNENFAGGLCLFIIIFLFGPALGNHLSKSCTVEVVEESPIYEMDESDCFYLVENTDGKCKLTIQTGNSENGQQLEHIWCDSFEEVAVDGESRIEITTYGLAEDWYELFMPVNEEVNCVVFVGQ